MRGAVRGLLHFERAGAPTVAPKWRRRQRRREEQQRIFGAAAAAGLIWLGKLVIVSRQGAGAPRSSFERPARGVHWLLLTLSLSVLRVVTRVCDGKPVSSRLSLA